MNGSLRLILPLPVLFTVVVGWYAASVLRTAPRIADETLKGNGLAMAVAMERMLELDPDGRRIGGFSPRDLAYFSVTDPEGTIRFHSNRSLVGGKDPSPPGSEWERVVLGTGEEIARLTVPVHRGGERLRLTLGLHTWRAEEVIRRARRGVTILAAGALLVWGVTGALIVLARKSARQEEELFRQREHARLGEMAAVLAHEIRNPLAGIKGFAQLIEQEGEGRVGDHARRIVSQSLRMERLVEDLLSYARTDDAPAGEIDLAATVGEAVALVEGEARASGVTVATSLEPLPPVAASPDRITQLMLNLLRNALQAMPEGGTLTVTLQQGGGEAMLTVRDTGCGIPADELPRVFEPFRTTKATGTGLGLAVCDAIVRRMGGRIEIASKVGAGTAVTVRIPLGRRR